MSKFFELALTLLYAPRCTFCGARLKHMDRTYVCSSCRTRLPYVERGCALCGRPIGENAMPVCLMCRKHKYPFSGAFVPFVYEGSVRDAVLRFKFGGKPHMARAFSILMCEKLLRDMPDVDFITYVPASKERLRERAYDQSELLAKGLSEITGLPLRNAVTHLNSRRQSELSSAERQQNARKSFVPKDITLSGNALLVDDILTTGATMAQCAGLLKKMGADKVYITAVAALPDKR